MSKPLEERRTYICCCGWFCSKEGHKGKEKALLARVSTR
jgi:hypothetical protein